jgi:selenocysteine-specific elongation factor
VSGPGPLTLGTAGHIDHGKTALVNALTGKNTDRLPEEQTRGISIALGYASLDTPAGHSVSIIDVPGHERFVRTMVAGATGIDAFLMVIAADDGVMPQTMEHAAVLSGLGVNRGVVAITKADTADPAEAIEQAHELLPGCDAIPCSAHTGSGLTDLLQAIDRVLGTIPSRAAVPGDAVLHIDRVFSLRGHGTIATGTLWSGPVARGETLALLPAEMPVRIRELEVHDKPVVQAEAGQRVALNLAGIRAREVHRGDVLATPGLLRETTTLDCALALTNGAHNMLVQAHHGTRESPARLIALGDDLWQLRLERPLISADGDRIVIRRPSPPDTLGGGIILDAHARRHGPRTDIVERLRRRRDGRPEPTTVPDSDTLPTPTADVRAVPTREQIAAVEQRLRDAGAQQLNLAQLDADADAVKVLRANRKIVAIAEDLFLHADVVRDAQQRIVALLAREQSLTLGAAREELGVSREAARALLQHFDSIALTQQLPDGRRVLRG